MNILHTVESYYPFVGGMQEVVKRLSELLAQMGHRVVVATSHHPERTDSVINGVEVKSFRISGNTVTGIHGKDVTEYVEFVKTGNFDIVANFAAQQWATDLLLPELENIKAKKVFIPTGFSNLFLSKYQNYYLTMPHYLRKYDLNIFLSEAYRDSLFAKKMGITNYAIIPNGADFEEFEKKTDPGEIRKKLKIPQDSFLVLLVGSHTGKKGHKEAISIFKKANINNSILLIAGNKVSEICSLTCGFKSKFYNTLHSNKKILNLDLNRQDIVSLLKSSDLFIFPSNIECSPIVLFEAMAAKLPFLVTDVGNSKEISNWSLGSGMVLPTEIDEDGFSHAKINESAELLKKVHANRNELKQKGLKGYDEWHKKFTWTHIAKQYEKTYANLLN
jgi:glycosyltransferase involved in cell wall biosynthesis